MYQIISLILAALGVVLLFAPEYILQKESTNQMIQTVFQYHQIIGAAVLGSAYYLYYYKPRSISETEVSSTSEATVESVTPPSYEQATSEA